MKTSCPKGIRASVLNKLWSASLALDQIQASAANTLDPPGSPLPHSPGWISNSPRLLDLRPTDAFLAGHLPQSCSLPAAEIESRTFELPPKWRPVILLSDDPDETRVVARNLFSRGWLRVIPLLENIEKWTGPWKTGPVTETLWEATPIISRWKNRLKPGRVLDLGCGSGRDSVTLSMMGGDVTSVDLLPDALGKAQQLADRMNVYLVSRLMDLRKQRPPADGGFDTILMIRFLERPLIPWAIKTLNPGGLLIMEVFRRDTVSATLSPHAKRFEPGEGLISFISAANSISEQSGDSPMHILEYAECFDESGQAITRLIARRPE